MVSDPKGEEDILNYYIYRVFLINEYDTGNVLTLMFGSIK